MFLEFILGAGELVLVVYCMRLAIRTYVQLKQPEWSSPLARRRLTVLLILTLGVVAIKLVEDVVTGESGAIDRIILVFIHEFFSNSLNGLFELITFSGSWSIVLLLTSASTFAMLVARRRFEALFVAASVLGAAAIVFWIKVVVDRQRPALWETHWYWGSSFPSGHTLVVAAFATALAVFVNRTWPRARTLATTTAACWISLVALSRLVLGVHWPTDVLAAACIGATLPLAISIAHDLYRAEFSLEQRKVP